MGRKQGRPRYETVPDEVRLYVRGGYGEIPGEIDPNLYDRIARGAEPSPKAGRHLPSTPVTPMRSRAWPMT